MISSKLLDEMKEALRRAMQAEHQGYYFYHMAAAHTEDARGKQVFADLAEQERQHFDYLRRQLHALESTGEPDPSVDFEVPDTDPATHPIFSDGIRSRIGGAHYEMTALAVGVQLEANSRDFYLEQAKKAGGGRLAEFFRKLAEWESVHYRLLLEQQQALQQDHWSAARFEPF